MTEGGSGAGKADFASVSIEKHGFEPVSDFLAGLDKDDRQFLSVENLQLLEALTGC